MPIYWQTDNILGNSHFTRPWDVDWPWHNWILVNCKNNIFEFNPGKKIVVTYIISQIVVNKYIFNLALKTTTRRLKKKKDYEEIKKTYIRRLR